MWRRMVMGWLLALAVSAPVVAAAGTSGEPAHSFGECLLRGGDVRREGDELLCRHLTSYTMRTYLSGTTECGEEVEYEIWDEVRYGSVTYAFSIHQVVELPEVVETWPESSATPIACQDPDS